MLHHLSAKHTFRAILLLAVLSLCMLNEAEVHLTDVEPGKARSALSLG